MTKREEQKIRLMAEFEFMKSRSCTPSEYWQWMVKVYDFISATKEDG